MPFSAQYLICRHVQTDRQTDELIRVELGNLSVPPVINPAYTHLYAAGCIAMNKIPYLPQFSGEMDHHWLKLKLEISRMQCMGEGEEGKVEWFEKRWWLTPRSSWLQPTMTAICPMETTVLSSARQNKWTPKARSSALLLVGVVMRRIETVTMTTTMGGGRRPCHGDR